jgi:hypothetical protein
VSSQSDLAGNRVTKSVQKSATKLACTAKKTKDTKNLVARSSKTTSQNNISPKIVSSGWDQDSDKDTNSDCSKTKKLTAPPLKPLLASSNILQRKKLLAVKLVANLWLPNLLISFKISKSVINGTIQNQGYYLTDGIITIQL